MATPESSPAPATLTLEEAAARLGISSRKLDGLIARGDILRTWNDAGEVVIEAGECDRWLASHKKA